MKKHILTTVIFTFLAMTSFAQEQLFKVMACKNAFLKTDTLHAFEQLESKQSLSLKTGGYAALIHKSGIPMEIKGAGTYSIDSLSKSLVSENGSFAEKYSGFLLDGFAAKVESSKDYEQVGGVTRGVNRIYVFSPIHFKVVEGIPVEVHWEAAVATDTYVFSVSDLSDNILFEKDSKTNSIAVDFANLPIAARAHYILKVYSKEKQSEIYSRKVRIDVATESESIELVSLHNKLVKEINPNSAMDNMMLASFYDSKGLNVYAASKLSLAAKLQPEVQDFEKAYKRYLGMNGMLPSQQ